MGIEAATYISDLQAANPGSSDLRSQGDDHLRLIKTVLQSTFPTASKAWYTPSAASKTVDYTVVAADMNKTFLVDTTAGVVNLTLPSLVSGDAGWECFLIKTNTGTNPVLVKPPSGTLSSGAATGLSAARRCIPNIRVSCFWTGTGFIISRSTNVPIGSAIDLHVATLPVGFEWPTGQTLASASTNYPEFNSINGSGVTLDVRGRLGVPLDNLGGSLASRLVGGIITGTTVGNVGGTDTVALTTPQLPSHTHTGITGIENAAHTHNGSVSGATNASSTGGGNFPAGFASSQLFTTGSQSANHAHNFTTDATGSGTGHSNLQPSIMITKVLVVE